MSMKPDLDDVDSRHRSARARAPARVRRGSGAETFAIAWRKRAHWSALAPEQQVAWLYGVARNVLANAHRARQRAAGLADPRERITPVNMNETIDDLRSPMAPPDESATVAAALDACSALWRIGFIQPGGIVTDVAAGAGQRAVPPLAACVLSSGEAAVFPGDSSACARLDLQVLSNRE